MSDGACPIFISYRRKDAQGHARALHRDLSRQFGEARIFFDRSSIEAGETFAERLGQAVRDCSALLALVGPGWLDAADASGRRRLEDPQDFVRQEIALALALGKRVIPVLFDDTPVPEAAQLPEPLRGLAGQDALTLRGKDYEYDSQLEALVSRLATITGRVPLASGDRARGPFAEPEKLPYLCDRSEQERAFRDALRLHLAGPSRRPLVMAVHGRANEAHQPFVERLEKLIVPRSLVGTPAAGHVRFLYLRRALPTDGTADLPRELREQIADELQEQHTDSDDVIVDYVRRQRLACFAAVTTWRSAECGSDPARALRSFADYWRGFPDTGEKALVVGILSLKYDAGELRPGLLGRLRRSLGGAPSHEATVRGALETLRQELERAADVSFRVLPELQSVKFPDLDGWAQEAAGLIGHLSERTLQAIIPPDETLPMDDVLERLARIVAERSTAEARRGVAP